MRRPYRSFAILLGVAGTFAVSVASARPVPALKGRVNDGAGLLSNRERALLEDRLRAYEERTGHQFALLTVDTLDGDPIEDFSIRVAETWRLGDAERDDGLIFVVVRDDRKMRIEVGYGLEGAVPDVVAKRILDDEVRPRFRKGDFEGGIGRAFERLMAAAAGESLKDPVSPAPAPGGGLSSPWIFIALAPLLLVLVRPRGGVSVAGALFGLMWGLPKGPVNAVVAAYVGAFVGLYYLGFGLGSSGARSGGGGFDGGFEGGGGDFGGGGASGDW